MAVKEQPQRDADLTRLPIFQNVPNDLLKRVNPEEMMHFFADGEVLFHQGDEGTDLVVLLHGQVRIVADDIYLVSRSAYEIVGEQAIINQTTRSATAYAQGLVKALIIPRDVVEQLMDSAAFLRNLLRDISAKLNEATGERAIRYRNEHLLFSEFRAHLSPEVTNRLLATGRAYGDPRFIDAIILYSDIRSYTARSARMTPQEIAEQLSHYLDAMVDVVHRHEGLVDKFVGDAVLAIWGFIPGKMNLATLAFACAREMLLLAALMHFGGEPIMIGIGLNAGETFIGNVGGEGKRQFTVLGSPVNLAARFQDETKFLGAPIVVGQDFYDRLPPDMREQFVQHKQLPIRGSGLHTLYSYGSAVKLEEEEMYELGVPTE